MKKLITLLLSSFLFIATTTCNATHIVGGVINYTWISGSTYEVTMRIYRDCSSTSGFDDPAQLGIFDELTNTRISIVNLNSPVITNIPPVINPCMVTPAICLEEGVYTATITLPNINRAYYLTYIRCCRNGSISNIPSPGTTGATYTVRIPASNPFQNSNPEYNAFPPIFVCQNAPLVFNNSATDIDGDSLYYELCNPYRGGSTGSPTPAPTAGPYTPLTYVSPYSATDPMGSTPPPAVVLTIDPDLGVLTGTPPTVGQFVVGICVSEYRDGVLLSTTLRDFQFNVVNCPIPVTNIPSTGIDPMTGIGTFQINCDSFTVAFRNTSSGAVAYHWDFGVASITTDTSILTSPRFTYTDTGIYRVRLIGYSADGCSDTTFAFVRVYPGFTPRIVFDNECVDTAVQFTDSSRATYGSINFWRWTFGDAPVVPNFTQNPSHLYGAPGTYVVSLQIKSDKGCDKTITRNVVIDPKPIANFTNDSTCINSAVAFRSTSTISRGTIRQYTWNFGDGSPTSSLSNPTHIYTSTGTYSVTLSILSDSGCSSTITKNITIFPRPIITTSPDTTICPGSRTQIVASGGLRYFWTPTSGLTSASIRNPFATPTVNTTYRVLVADSNRCNSTDSVRVNLFVNMPNFTFTNECRDTAVQFIDLSSSTGGTINNWSWNFGDITTSALQNPLHLYATQGLYNVKLIFTTDRGCRDSTTKQVRIYPIPNPGFTFDSACIGYAIYFKDTTRYFLQSDSIRSRNWTFSNGFSINNVNATNTIFNTSGTHTATLTVVSDSGCMQSITRTFIVNPLPNINLTNDTIICPFLPIQLNSNGGTSYFWTRDITLSDTSISNPIANPINTPTTYYVRIADVNRCQNNDSVKISLHTLYPVDAGKDTNVCLSPGSFFDSTQLVASGGISYSWTPIYNISNPTINNPFVAPDVNTTYFVAITDTNNCTQIDSVIVIVLDPTLNIITATDTFLCLNDTIQIPIIDQGVAGYTWSPNLWISSNVVQSPRFFTRDTTEYIVTVNNYCYTKKDTITIFTYPLPFPNFTYDTTCIFSPINFINLSTGNIASWYWNFGDSSFSNLQNPIHTYTIDSTFRVVLIDTSNLGCFDSVVKMLTVHPLPIITGTPDTNLCPNEYTTLSLTGGTSYEWSPAANLDNAFISSPTTNILTDQTYNVIITDDNSCNNFDTIKVHYYFLNPDFYLSNECLDTAVQFYDSTKTDAGIVNSWLWAMDDGHTDNIQNPIYEYPLPGNYNVTLTVTTSAGCDTSITKPLTIFPLPTLNIPRIDSICIGETYQINADSTLFYAWDPSLTLTPTNVHNPLLNPLVNTKYMVTLRDSNFCVNRDSFTLFVLLLPNANIANVPAILCRGDNLSLNASGGGTYLWTPGNPLNDSISANPSLILTDSTKYILEVTSALGCKNYDTIQLNVQQPIVATTSADTAICKGTQIQIFSLGGLYYSWSPNAFIAGSNLQQNPFVTPDSTIQYIVNVSNDCFSDTAIVNININPLPLANAGPDQTIYRNTSATLDASGTGDFIWYPATNLSNPYSEITVASPLETTSYLLIVTDANGCINYDTVKVEVIGNTLLLLPTAFSPNGDGVNDVFRISKWLNIEKLESFNIYNRWGELVFNTLDIDAGWDGTYKNYPQPTSSFDWVVKAKDYDGNIIIKSGIVTLIR